MVLHFKCESYDELLSLLISGTAFRGVGHRGLHKNQRLTKYKFVNAIVNDTAVLALKYLIGRIIVTHVKSGRVPTINSN